MKHDRLFLAVLGFLTCVRLSYGLVTMEVGPDSARGHPTIAQPGWPVGLVELPRHEARVYSVCATGWEGFYFKATPDQVNEMILLFSTARMRDHEMRIKDRKKRTESLGADKYEYNMQLEVVEGIARHRADEAEEPSTHEPVLTLYVDLPADRVWVEKLKLPDNIIVNNEVAALPLKGKATKPQREIWYAQVQFQHDASPATNYEHGVITKVALWETGVKEEIKLGRVDLKGYFHAAFSDREITELKAGRSWLTLTAGNWLTEPKSSDARIDWKHLAREKEKTKPVKVAKPSLYYGRILFEDGAPATRGAWLGREITVSFCYAGIARPDPDGYILVCFTGDQYEQAKAKKEGKNIYIPDEDDSSTATARFVFPVAKLSRDKDKAGEVRIPRPGSRKDD